MKESELEVVCIRDSKILRIYKDTSSVILDGFIPKIIKDCIKSGTEYYNCTWKYITSVPEEMIKEYSESPDWDCPELNTIVKCNASGEFLCTYQFPEVSIVSKILKKPVTDRLYKGNLWYRINEYLDVSGTTEIPETYTPELNIVLTITEKLVSVNDLYKARVQYSGGRAFPVVYKNPKAVKISQANRDQLLALDLRKYKPWLEKTKNYSIRLNFVLKSGISTRDLGNVEKQISDDLVRYISQDLGVEHFDDSEFLEMSMNKSIIPEAEREYVFIQLTESFHNVRFDKVEKPEKVYIDIDPSLKARMKWIDIIQTKYKDSLEFYDPSGNKYCSEYNRYQRSNGCNVVLSIIDYTEGWKGIEKLVSLADDIEDCVYKDRGFVWIGISGDIENWGKDSWELLMSLKNKLTKTYKSSRVQIKEISDDPTVIIKL